MNNWTKGTDYPEWMTDEGLKTLSNGYLLKDETPKAMYERVSWAAAVALGNHSLSKKFFDVLVFGIHCSIFL